MPAAAAKAAASRSPRMPPKPPNWRSKILGMTLVTHQTGPEGRVVQRLLIEETLPIERELYLGIVLDRAFGQSVFMASKAGGMEIEEVAANTPELILKEPLIPGLGLQPFQARKLAFGMGIPADQCGSCRGSDDRAR